MTRVLVIGADAAGMTAASAIMRQVDDVEVIVLESGHRTSYSACGIPYWVAGDLAGPDQLVARTPKEHRDRGIDVRLGHTVVAVDTERRRVTVREEPDGFGLDGFGPDGFGLDGFGPDGFGPDGSGPDGSGPDGSGPDGFSRHDVGKTYELAWDRLVVATGAAPVVPDVPGAHGGGIHVVKTLADGQAIVDRLADVHHVVVVGSGYIGVEMAEACVMRGLTTTVVDRGSRPLGFVEPAIGAVVEHRMREAGVDLRLDTTVDGFELDDTGHVRRVLTDDRHIETDLVIMGLGVTARSELIAGTGPAGAIVVDEQGRVTGRSDVWAAGDCVAVLDRITGQHAHMPLGTHANRLGLVVGESVAASLGAQWSGRTFPGVVRTAITRFCELEIARVGVGENAARDAGFDPVTATIETTTTASYWPAAAPVTVAGVADRSTRRLLGVHLAGGPGAGLRIDAAAMALWSELTVDEMVMTDLAYAPPFSSVWSPVQVIARALVKLLGPPSRTT